MAGTRAAVRRAEEGREACWASPAIALTSAPRGQRCCPAEGEWGCHSLVRSLELSWLASQPLGETQGDGWQQTAPSSRVRPQPPQSSCWASEKLPQVTRAQWQLRVTPRAPIAGAGCQEAPQPQQEGAAGATGVHARLGPPCPPLSAATPTGPRPARTRAHAPYTVIRTLGTLRAAQRAPQTPDTPRRLRALHAQAERAQAPAALRPPAPARSPEPPSHGCRRDTHRSPADVRAGTRMPAWTRAGPRVWLPASRPQGFAGC